jgi:hypothetical protein
MQSVSQSVYHSSRGDPGYIVELKPLIQRPFYFQPLRSNGYFRCAAGENKSIN